MTRLLGSLKVWQKALLPLTLCALVAIGLSTKLIVELERSSTEYDTLLDREAPAAVWAARLHVTTLDLSRLVWRGIADDTSDLAQERREIDALLAQFRERAAQVEGYLGRNHPLAAGLPGFVQRFEAMHAAALQGIAISGAGKQAEAVAHLRQNFTPQLNAQRDALRSFADTIIRESSTTSDRLTREADSARDTSIVIALAALALVIALGVWIALKGLVAPVRGLTTTMDALAAGKLDTTVPGTDRGDEIGIMARSVETFRQGLVEVERLKAEQESLKQRAEADKRAAMNTLADRFQGSVGSVVQALSSASTELTAAAGSMASIAEETSRQATTVASASEQATTNVQTVASAAEELSSSVSEISRQVAQSTQIAGQAMGEVTQTNETVQGLTASVARISEVVRLISEIASQTNLLALNATIEAARAGDAGKGFAVVASEVKHLATQTARATEDITGRINEIQSATGESVAAIDRINKVIQQMNEISLAIASAVEEQGAATQEIARNVAQAADGTQLVSSNILSVTQASAETGTADGQVQASSAEVAQQAEGLKHQVDAFLQQVRAA
jgi:methyl-accepting chemotaxis protein